MTNHTVPRRRFLANTGWAAGAFLAGGKTGIAESQTPKPGLHLASNNYSWTVFYERENRDFNKSLDTGLQDVAAGGIDGFEPSVTSPQQLDELIPLLRKHHLEMRSLYVNSSMLTTEEADKSIAQIPAIAEKAKSYNAKIIVTNPNPIRWGGNESKSDAQLQLQAKALNTLGEKLAALGLTLAYHNHDVELRNAAREFHHMMVGTDPKFVTLCLDAHWIYRGSGNSQVALFDIVRLYGKRITELHLRQSVNQIWSETFGEGDIDYPSLVEQLRALQIKPHLVLEIAVEKGTPKTMDPVTAHRRSSEYARKIFS